MAATDTLSAEFAALRERAGLADRSERGKLALTGSERRSFMHGQVTNDVEALEAGHGCYAAFLTHKGRMLGDVRILETGDELLLDTERPALQALFTMIRRYKLASDVELHKRTLERGMLSLVGPRAAAIAGIDPGPREHDHAAGTIGGIAVRAIATPEGLDLLCDAADTEALAQALVAAGAQRVSDEVLEAWRIARGVPRFGLDMGEDTIPQEAGVNERAVSFTKGCYVGQETVARLHYKGKPNRHLRGLALEAPAAHGDPVVLGDREVGTVGSAAVHPGLGPIALAILRREAQPGAQVTVAGLPATVVELPFA